MREGRGSLRKQLLSGRNLEETFRSSGCLQWFIRSLAFGVHSSLQFSLCLILSPVLYKYGVAHGYSLLGLAIWWEDAAGFPLPPAMASPWGAGPLPTESGRAGGCRRAGLWPAPRSTATDSRCDLGNSLPSLGPSGPYARKKKKQARLFLNIQIAGCWVLADFTKSESPGRFPKS